METRTDEPGEHDAVRKMWKPIVAAVLVVVVLAFGWMFVSDARLAFAYETEEEATSPGGTVTVSAPGSECGPLIVSLHRESVLGFWSQTHSGNVVDGFVPDDKPWWSIGSASYFTPVPCSLGGSTTLELPEDVSAGVVAACDSDGRCARVRVAE